MNPATLENRVIQWKSQLAQRSQKYQPLKTAADLALQQLNNHKTAIANQQQLVIANQAKIKLATDAATLAQQKLEQSNVSIQQSQEQIQSQTEARPLINESLVKASQASQKLPNDDSLKQTVAQLSAKLGSIDKSLVDLKSKVEFETKQKTELMAEIPRRQVAAKQQQDQKSQLNATLVQLNQLLPAKQQQFNTARQNADAVLQRVTFAQQQVQRWENEIAFHNQLQALTDQLKTLDASIAKANEKVAAEQALVNAANAKLNAAKAEADAARKSADELKTKIRQAKGVK
jgi:chromosome segregation ATPase